MDQVTRVRKYIKREQWKTLIQECQSSGMTVSAWCKVNDICEQTYYRNLKLLREEVCNNLPVSLPDTCEKRKHSVIEHLRKTVLDCIFRPNCYANTIGISMHFGWNMQL